MCQRSNSIKMKEAPDPGGSGVHPPRHIYASFWGRLLPCCQRWCKTLAFVAFEHRILKSRARDPKQKRQLISPTSVAAVQNRSLKRYLVVWVGFFFLPSPIILNFQHSHKQRRWGDVSRFIFYWVGFLPPEFLRAVAKQHKRRDLASGGGEKNAHVVCFVFFAVVFLFL